MPTGHFPRHKYRNPPHCRSGFKGVIFCPHTQRKPWKAYGRQHGQFVCIGYFETKEEAGEAYNAWALRVYGPTAYLNPVPQTA